MIGCLTLVPSWCMCKMKTAFYVSVPEITKLDLKGEQDVYPGATTLRCSPE